MARATMTETASNGSEIYTSQINQLCTQYIEDRLKLNPDDMDEDGIKLVHDNFTDMVFYIADRTPRPDTADIEMLDRIFDCYVRLCSRYRILPTVEVFSFLVKIDRSTFNSWARGEYRASTAHSPTVQKWIDTCKGMVIDRLSNSNGGNVVGQIFIAKAAYKMSDSPAPTPPAIMQEQTASVDEIRARYASAALPEPPEEPED